MKVILQLTVRIAVQFLGQEMDAIESIGVVGRFLRRSASRQVGAWS